MLPIDLNIIIGHLAWPVSLGTFAWLIVRTICASINYERRCAHEEVILKLDQPSIPQLPESGPTK